MEQHMAPYQKVIALGRAVTVVVTLARQSRLVE